MPGESKEQADTAEMLAEAERLRRRDLSVLWHPCTQMAEHPDPLPLVPIRRGRGAFKARFEIGHAHHHLSGVKRPAACSMTSPSENSVSSSKGRPIS